jgi:hypothetical protein
MSHDEMRVLSMSMGGKVLRAVLQKRRLFECEDGSFFYQWEEIRPLEIRPTPDGKGEIVFDPKEEVNT